jgi:hypothetical protein
VVRQRVHLISSVRFMLGEPRRAPSLTEHAYFCQARPHPARRKDATPLPIIEPTLQVLETLNEKIRELDHQIEKALAMSARTSDWCPGVINPEHSTSS